MLYRADIMLKLDDFFVSFVWLCLVGIGMFYFRNTRYAITEPTRKYFFPALALKIFGGIGVGLVYLLYYKGGDTASYFLSSYGIYRAFLDNFENGWILLTTNTWDYRPGEWELLHTDLYYTYVNHFIQYHRDPNALFVSRLVLIPTFLTFGNYFATSILVSAFSFLGIWGLFRVFIYEFPKLREQFAFAIFFVPSVWFWGSGILKDSITFSFLGFITYYIHAIAIRKKYNPIYFILVLVSAYAIFNIKSYILVSYVPFVVLWIGFRLRSSIKNSFFRVGLTPFIILVFIVGSYFSLVRLSEASSKFSLDKVLTTAQTNRKDLNSAYYYADGKGSSYDIGDFEPTPAGVAQKLPIAVATTFFRPYLWEARSPLMLLSAIESLLVFLYTLRLFIRIGFLRFFLLLSSQNVLFFTFGYSISFAFMVGLSSGNFGNLVRYKIPCIPFLLISLIIMNYLIDAERKRLEEYRLWVLEQRRRGAPVRL